MKFGSILACLLTLASLAPAQAQTDVPKSRLYISDLYIQTGVMVERMAPLTLADYRSFAPNSPLLKNDLTNYNNYNSYRQTSSAPLFSMLLGIKFKENSKWQLRAGFTTTYQDVAQTSYRRETIKRYDTLVSNQTGANTYIDSVNTRSYALSYSRQQMRLEASFIYQSNPNQEKRWNFYAGLGMALIMNLNNTTNIDFYDARYTEISRNSLNSFQYYRFGSSYESARGINEEYRHKNNMGFAVFLPLGIDFRIGRTHSFWSRLHLLYEMRPSLTFNSVEGISQVSLNSGQHNFGLKIRMR